MTTFTWARGHHISDHGDGWTVREREAVQVAKSRAAEVVLMDIKHMAERFVPVVEESGTHLWLFYLPDFTRLFKDWYVSYLAHIFEVYAPAATALLEFDETYLVLRYEGERPRDIITRAVETGDEDAVRDLVRCAREAEGRCALAIRRFEQALAMGQVLVPDLIEPVSHFAAFALDNVFPESILREQFPTLELGRAYHTPVSAWATLYEQARDALERIYVGEASEEIMIERYVGEASYLRWGDIASRDEDLEWSHRFIAGMRRTFPHYPSIWQAQVAEREGLRIHGSRAARHERYLATHRACISPAERPLFDLLTWFAAEAQRYNEMRRMLFTRTLRLLREAGELVGADWRTVSLATLADQNEKARQGLFERR